MYPVNIGVAALCILLGCSCFALELNCTSERHDHVCYFPVGFSPDRILVDGDSVFVGSTDYLFMLSTSEGLQLKQMLDVSPTQSRRDSCTEDASVCRNFVRLILPISTSSLPRELRQRYDNSILVCGTNAFFPKCSVHKRSNLTDRFFVTAADHPDEGFSPYSKEQNIGLLADNGNYYASTIFQRHQQRSRIAVAHNPLEANASFIAATQENNRLWLFETARFVSMLETDTHIYVFAREPAFEIDNGNSMMVSRVVRICKTDSGIMEGSFQPGDIARWRTYQKLTLKCSHGSSLAFEYNELTAVHVYNPTNGEPVVYATFSAPTNGPQGSAICKFSFSALTTIFESGMFYVKEPNEWVQVNSAQFACPGGPIGEQRENKDALRNLLMFTAAESSALYRLQGDEYTQIAADGYRYGGVDYEVIFVGKEKGEVWTIVRRNGTDLNRYKLFTPMTRMKPITHLQLDTTLANEIRRLFVATEDLLSELTLGNCSRYESCSECMESNDPYCVWLNNTQQCHNKLTNYSPIVGALETVEPRNSTQLAAICKTPPTTRPTTQPVSTTVGSTRKPTDSPSPSPSRYIAPTQSIFTGGIATKAPVSSFPAGGSAGIAVAGVIIGLIIGTLGCFVGLVVKRVLTGEKSSDPAVILNHNHQHITRANGNSIHNNNNTSIEIQSSSNNIDYDRRVSLTLPAEDLDDDVIADLPTNNKKANKWPVPRGRTPSTRWLRESESDLPSP